MLEQVLASLVEITKDIVGAKVENNKFCVSVHYRNVDKKVLFVFKKSVSLSIFETLDVSLKLKTDIIYLQCWKTIGESVNDLLKQYPRLRLTHGRKVSLCAFFPFSSMHYALGWLIFLFAHFQLDSYAS